MYIRARFTVVVYQVPVFFGGGTCTFVHGSLLYNMHIYIYICVTKAVCVCRTMYVWPSQPGKVANPARGQQLNRENDFIRCPRSRLRIWYRETGSAVPSRVSLLISILQSESSSACLQNSSRVPRRRPFIMGTHYVL